MAIKMISFSGIDGSGKGTQIALVEDYFRASNIKYKTIWARGSWTPGIELVKKIVRRDHGFSEEEKQKYREEARTNPRKQKIILLLSIIDLYWYFGLYYRLIGLCGTVVICDRYIWDTLADFRVNFSKHNIENWIIWKMLLKVIPKPHSSFIFVISAEQSIERGLRKKEAHMESLDVKSRKIEEYMNLIHQGKWSHVVDGKLTVTEIHNIVLEEITNENR